MRVILLTGKGGVGKTSVAAATAMRCAQLGHRTIVMSTDPAHSLGDSFDLELGAKPKRVAANLWAHEVSALHEMERHWKRLHDYAASVFATQGLDDVVAEEVANPPGMDEIASLMWIKHYAEKGEHDVIVVDCAPTGETLQLLVFPDAARWWLDKIFPWERRAMKIARPVLQPLMEKMVVKEAKRAFTYLSLFGYVTDAVVVNRLLPDGLHDELFRKWHAIHQRYAGEVEQSFAPLPIFNVPLFDEEVVGERMLLRMAESIYGDRDPADRYYRGTSQRVEKVGPEYVLALKVPFAQRGDITLARQDGELFVTVGNYRREIALPRVLASRDTVGAAIEDGELRVRFGRGSPPAEGRA